MLRKFKLFSKDHTTENTSILELKFQSIIISDNIKGNINGRSTDNDISIESAAIHENNSMAKKLEYGLMQIITTIRNFGSRKLTPHGTCKLKLCHAN